MTYSNTAITPLDTLFQFYGQQIQTATDENGTLWACAKDVFDALGIVWNGSQSLRNMPERWKGVIKLMTPSGSQDTIFIAEPNIYRVIFRSTKQEAERFIEWLTEEVLPAIRKRGFYGSIDLKERTHLRKEHAFWLDRLNTTDAAQFEVALQHVHEISDMLGMRRVDPTNVGMDRKQLPLFKGGM